MERVNWFSVCMGVCVWSELGGKPKVNKCTAPGVQPQLQISKYLNQTSKCDSTEMLNTNSHYANELMCYALLGKL